MIQAVLTGVLGRCFDRAANAAAALLAGGRDVAHRRRPTCATPLIGARAAVLETPQQHRLPA